MKIKQATLKNIEPILKYLGKKTISRKNWHIPHKKFISSYIKNKHNFFFIALDEKKVIGMINGELWGDKGFAYIGEISAKSKNQQEIINKLFVYFKKFCKKKGIKLINTYVNKSKTKRIEIYKKLGMKKIGKYIGLEKRI